MRLQIKSNLKILFHDSKSNFMSLHLKFNDFAPKNSNLGDKHADKHSHTHQYHDSAWPRGRAE